jgi:hypothetical protein
MLCLFKKTVYCIFVGTLGVGGEANKRDAGTRICDGRVKYCLQKQKERNEDARRKHELNILNFYLGKVLNGLLKFCPYI